MKIGPTNATIVRWLNSPLVLVLLLVVFGIVGFWLKDWDDRRRASILADEFQKRGMVPTEVRK